MLRIQAAVYGLYHMSNPDVFYTARIFGALPRKQGRRISPTPYGTDFVLMTLPGERATEFIEILPFTTRIAITLIGWIAGAATAKHYGQAVVYDFPKSKLIDDRFRSKRASIRTHSCRDS